LGHELRVRQLARQFNMRLDERIGERTRIARDLHDTLLQSFHGLLFGFRRCRICYRRARRSQQQLDNAIDQAAKAITEGRTPCRACGRPSSKATISRWQSEPSATSSRPTERHPPPAFRVAVEGHARDLNPILRDEIYKIAAEALRNSFRHAQSGRVEVEIRYKSDDFDCGEGRRKRN
jgi:signal transduction histidine kinase